VQLLGHLFLVISHGCLVEVLCNQEVEDGVAQELKPLVVIDWIDFSISFLWLISSASILILLRSCNVRNVCIAYRIQSLI